MAALALALLVTTLVYGPVLRAVSPAFASTARSRKEPMRMPPRTALRRPENVLEIDGVPAASLIGLEWNSRAYALVSDFDERFRTYSPGRLAIAEHIRRAPERGLHEVDLLRRTHFIEVFSETYFETERFLLFARLGPEALIHRGSEGLKRFARMGARRNRGGGPRRRDFASGVGG